MKTNNRLQDVIWQRVFRGASEFKVRKLICWTRYFAIYVRWLLGWRYISSLHSADEPQEGRNSCPLLRSYFIGSCHVGVSKRFSRSISLAIYCLSLKKNTQPRWALNLSPRYSHVILQRIVCCDSCQLTIAWTLKIKDEAIIMCSS